MCFITYQWVFENVIVDATTYIIMSTCKLIPYGKVRNLVDLGINDITGNSI